MKEQFEKKIVKVVLDCEEKYKEKNSVVVEEMLMKQKEQHASEVVIILFCPEKMRSENSLPQ